MDKETGAKLQGIHDSLVELTADVKHSNKRLDEIVDRHDLSLYGDGSKDNLGVVGDVVILNDHDESRMRHIKILWGAFASAVLGWLASHIKF